MYAITHNLPSGDDISVTAETPAEEIRSVYHAVTWAKELGGAGITPNFGKWERITASFPLHDKDACTELLRAFSRKIVLSVRDLDTIRALFGEKVSLRIPHVRIVDIPVLTISGRFLLRLHSILLACSRCPRWSGYNRLALFRPLFDCHWCNAMYLVHLLR